MGGHEVFDAFDAAQRIDRCDALRHGVGFGLAEHALERVHLAVDVRFGNHVEIDQRNVADR